jgi:hypothetical protein
VLFEFWLDVPDWNWTLAPNVVSTFPETLPKSGIDPSPWTPVVIEPFAPTVLDVFSPSVIVSDSCSVKFHDQFSPFVVEKLKLFCSVVL